MATALPTGPLTGTWRLVRFALRRDRRKFPGWVLGVTLMVVYFSNALPILFGSEEQLEGATGFLAGPVGAIFGGPGYGFEELTIERFLVGEYGLYIMIMAAIMSFLLVSRHTRVEEQSGRAELVLANVVGRDAPLTSALLLALFANLGVSVLVPLALIGKGYAAGDSFVFGLGIGAVGLCFAGVAAITTQVTEYSRGASGLAGIVLGAAFMIRAAGDMMQVHGSALSWFSPLAWSQQTRAFVDPRWWPLLISIAFAVVTASIGYGLSRRRDFGAGLIEMRPGSARAARWLESMPAVAFRLHRASILGWSAAMLVAGFGYGIITQPVVDGLADMSEETVRIFGGAGTLVDGYLAAMAVFDAVLVGVFGVLGVQSARSEETEGRLEPVLAGSVGRAMWLGSNLAVLALGAAVVLFVSGLGTAIGAVIGTGQSDYLWSVTLGHIAYVPALLVVLGLAGLLLGLLPRAVPVTWGVVFYGMLIGFFARLWDVPQWVFNLSPFDHIARIPGEDLAWAPVSILALIGVGLATAGLAAFRRRDLTAT